MKKEEPSLAPQKQKCRQASDETKGVKDAKGKGKGQG